MDIGEMAANDNWDARQRRDVAAQMEAALTEKDERIAELVAVLQSVQLAAWDCYSEARNQIKAGEAVDALQRIQSMHREYYDKARAAIAKHIIKGDPNERSS